MSDTNMRHGFIFILRCFAVALCLSMFSSCTNYKKIAYFQDVDNSIEALKIYDEYNIQPKDVLQIEAKSINKEADALFNVSTNLSIANKTPAPNYIVSELGEIDLPLIGIIKVAGLTTEKVKEKIKAQLSKYLTNPFVSVVISNFHVSVLGEVNKPGIYNVNNEKISVLESLGLASDMTIYGKRNNVLVIRQINGKISTARLDVTSKEIFKSPFFYLKSNDIVYVEPSRSKIAQNDTRRMQLVPIVLSTLSFIALIVRFY